MATDFVIKDTSGITRLEGTLTPDPLAAPTFTGTVTLGSTVVASLPTADPHVVGQLWANAGVVTVSAG